jgi:hypothetical protein
MRFTLSHSESNAVRRILFAALAAATMMALAIAAPNHAAGAVGGFCGNVLLPGGTNQYCEGSYVREYEIGGWGDQHSVCVRGRELGYVACAPLGETAYDPMPFELSDFPQIWNNAAGANRVHGFYYYN